MKISKPVPELYLSKREVELAKIITARSLSRVEEVTKGNNESWESHKGLREDITALKYTLEDASDAIKVTANKKVLSMLFGQTDVVLSNLRSKNLKEKTNSLSDDGFTDAELFAFLTKVYKAL